MLSSAGGGKGERDDCACAGGHDQPCDETERAPDPLPSVVQSLQALERAIRKLVLSTDTLGQPPSIDHREPSTFGRIATRARDASPRTVPAVIPRASPASSLV